MKVQKNTSKTGNREMSLSLFQVMVLIRLASSSSQEANAMLSLSYEWLEWYGEVKMQALFFGYGGRWWRCYSHVTGCGIVWRWCLGTFGSERPRNARGKCEFGMKSQKNTLKNENCILSLSLFQVMVMIWIVSSSSQEANATFTWSWKCLNRAREVNVKHPIFGHGGRWWRC